MWARVLGRSSPPGHGCRGDCREGRSGDGGTAGAVMMGVARVVGVVGDVEADFSRRWDGGTGNGRAEGETR